MADFCPLIRERCKTNECMAWKDDACIILSFLKVSVSLPEREYADIGTYETEFARLQLESEAPREVPPKIRSAAPEELAAELVAFAKREFSHEERISISHAAQFFWEEKGMEKWTMPSDIKLKLEKAERLAQQQLDSERERETQAQLEIEKAELPHLITRCIEWARKYDLNRLTQADVEAFLLEEKVEILPQTERALYATANVQLKSAKRK